MESQDSPALHVKGVNVVHIKQRKAGRILFKKKRNYAFLPDGRILMKIVSEQVFRRTKTPIRLEHFVSRNGPRPREQYGYLSAREILCNHDVIILDGNLVGTRRLGDSRGSSPGVTKWHVSGIQTVMCHLMGTICTRVRSYSAIVHVYCLHCLVPKHEYYICTICGTDGHVYYSCTIYSTAVL
jgi:hypothetical protein